MTTKTELSAHDRHMRALLADPAIAREVLAHFLPPHLLARVKLDTLKPVPTSFINDALREKIADVLYEVEAEGVTAFIYVLIEHTSRSDRLMPLRLAGYVIEIALQAAKKAKAGKLPLVFPILIHNGPRPYRQSLDVRTLFDAPPAIVEQAILGPFLLIDLNTLPDEVFNEFSKFGAGGLLAKHIYDSDLTPLAETIAKHLHTLEKQHETSHIRRIVEYMLTRGNIGDPTGFVHTLGEHLADLDEEKIMTVVEYFAQKKAEAFRQEVLEQGIEQGRQQGVEQGVEKVAREMLGDGVSVETVSVYTSLPVETLKGWFH